MNLLSYLPLLKDQRIMRGTLARRSGAPREREYARGETELAVRRYHPPSLAVRVAAAREETPRARTLSLAALEGELPPYLPGQYVNLFVTIGGLRTSRPMSLSSSPTRTSLLEVTVQAMAGGLVSRHLVERVQVGDPLTISSPAGDFHHHPVRDRDDLVFLAGGSGITPFMGMAEYLLDRRPLVRVTLICGWRRSSEIIFARRLAALAASSSRLRVVHVLSEPEAGWSGEVGLLDEGLLRRVLGPPRGEQTYFVCGPRAMNELVVSALRELGVPRAAIRVEAPAPPDDIAQAEGWPAGLSPEARFSVRLPYRERVVEARAGEPLMSALERAGLVLPALCRAGTCASCRTRLALGEVFTAPGVVRRPSDLASGHIHPCVSYALSDLVLGSG